MFKWWEEIGFNNGLPYRPGVSFYIYLFDFVLSCVPIMHIAGETISYIIISLSRREGMAGRGKGERGII